MDKERARECLSWADGGVYSHLSCYSVCVLTLTSRAELQHRTRSQLANNTDPRMQLGEGEALVCQLNTLEEQTLMQY